MSTGMLTVACVHKSGGEYRPEHVRALKAGFASHLSRPHRFVCLTDEFAGGYDTVGLLHDWPGWWSKIELFRPGIFAGPVLYADLDTVLVGPIDDLVDGHRFTVLRNMWVSDANPRIGSGLMAWDCDLSALYEQFKADPARHMAGCVTTDNWGDQGFIRHHAPIPMERWQTKFPGRIVSWKRECGRGVPKAASIVCFHGKPRPWETSLWKPAA